MDKGYLKSVIESILFLSQDAVSTEKIAKVLNIPKDQVENLIDELKEEYYTQKRGFIIVKQTEGYVMVTNPENFKYIREFLNIEQKSSTLSQAAYETLAIIALNGPITRQEVEKIRGVSSDNIIKSLQEKGLIKEAGRLETIGRPVLYEVTELFFRSLGVENLDELKKMAEMEDK